MAQERAALSQPAAKKKGLKSSLGRIFGKKDKTIKTRSGGFVTAPLSVNQHHPFAEPEMVQSDSMAGGLAGEGDFDRRKKKK